VRSILRLCVVVVVLVGLCAVNSPAQINTAQLSGHVLDPDGKTVAGAKITVKNLATGAERDTSADGGGHYQIVGLPPGRYELSAEGGSGFAKFHNPELVLTIGEDATYDPRMEIQAANVNVNVTSTPDVIETSRTQTTSTVDQRQIDNLPINGRSYINFTLISSETHRDNAPVLGPAPASGLSFNGQRSRSNEVSVDGADAVDNSVNGIRATVSQEAVQEFQIIQSNYMPEFGRAVGGVVNIVTKSGSNDTHGNIFGFLRDKDFQARNAFSDVVDPTTGNLVPIKQPYTRVQAGATLGGHIQKDKTFYFLSYETTHRQETGFNTIGEDNFGLGVAAIPCLFPMTMTEGPAGINDTTGQLGYYRANLNALTGNGAACSSANPTIEGEIAGLEQAALITGAASNVALNGDMNKNLDGSVVPISTTLGIPSGFGSKFFPPAFLSSTGGLPVSIPTPSFVPLLSLRGNFPVSESTALWSGRLDHIWNQRNTSFLRVSASPSTLTGLSGSGENQVPGQNAFSRAANQNSHDIAVVAQHSTAISNSLYNEARFQFARRSVFYGPSTSPGGSDVGIDILGYGSFGQEPFAPVHRIERRLQWTDNLSWTKGKHIFKLGVDANLVQLRSDTSQIFELDFGGDYRFGSLPASETGLPTPLSAVQAYGFGVPGSYIQGVGTSGRFFDDKIFAGFAQDSWKIFPRLTLNYGVRYDVELTPLFTPVTAANAAAESSLNVVEGLPRDYNNFSPRASLAWDPFGDGKTVIRAGYGVFYDHPPLAVAFLAATADGAQSVQLEFGGGTPSSAALTPANAASVLNASTLFQGILNAPASLGYQTPSTGPASANQMRFDPFLANSFFTNQNFLSPSAGLPLTVLPFTYPVAKNFQFAMSQQATLSIERQLGRSWKISAAYTFIHGTHLNRPRNINTANAALLLANFSNAAVAGLPDSSGPEGISAPTANVAPTASTCGVTAIAPGILGELGGCPASLAAYNGHFVTSPAVFNFYRATGPNPSFASLVPGGYGTAATPGSLEGFAALAGLPVGSGTPVPFGDVIQQESTGSSLYDGLTVTISKRFSHSFQLVSNYTWSHAIDDSTDLQSLLEPMDNNNPGLDRSNSTFDQRQRWVTSGVFTTGYKWSDGGFVHRLLADFTLSPIIEVASGRPYNVLTGNDYNMDFSPLTDRPSIVAVGTAGSVASPYLKGVAFAVPSPTNSSDCAAASGPGLALELSAGLGCGGNLGRNAFTTPGYFNVDLRLSRRFALSERINMDVIADMFNLLNRDNIQSVNVLCDPGAGAGGCLAGQPTASFDARQFQFALKVSF
jgi:hypothetical protein